MRPVPIGRVADEKRPLSLAVLISGRGSNMKAIMDAIDDRRLHARIDVVLSNRQNAQGLAIARSRGIVTKAWDFQGRDDDRYHQWLVKELEQVQPEVIVLAGYMRILPPWVVDRFRHRIVNIHPSLLPSFPGLHPHAQAIKYGVKYSGCTVHLVDHGVDEGPIIVQEAVPVRDDDTPESLAARILAVEHQLYPEALRLMTTGTLYIEGRRVVQREEHPDVGG